MIYNEQVLSLFFQPEHSGLLSEEKPEQVVRYANSNGDQTIHFYIYNPRSGGTPRLRYLVKGNPYMVAGAEWMVQSVEKNKSASILDTMSASYWQSLFDIPRLQRATAISLSQAAQQLAGALA